MKSKNIEKIKHFAKEHLDKLRWAHTQDVVKIALILAEKEKADKEIVEISAWLHDVGFSDKKAKIITHHVYSAKMVQDFLTKLNFESKKIKQVVQCIKEHMGPIPGFLGPMLKAEGKNWDFLPRPSIKESRVLFDADMINLCSPFGIAKMIFLSAQMDIDFQKAIDSAKVLAKQALANLKTKTGKKIVKKYFSISERFLNMIKT